MLINYVAEFEMKRKQADLEKVSRMAWMWNQKHNEEQAEKKSMDCCLFLPQRNVCMTC